MILSYTFPQFEAKILSGEKQTTFRRDPKKRWKRGMLIQHWMGSPRNAKLNPRHFMDDFCDDVFDVVLERSTTAGLEITFFRNDNLQPVTNRVSLEIARRDGFENVEEMGNYFCPDGRKWEGRMILFGKFIRTRS